VPDDGELAPIEARADAQERPLQALENDPARVLTADREQRADGEGFVPAAERDALDLRARLPGQPAR
jgi:hypothetical protein